MRTTTAGMRWRRLAVVIAIIPATVMAACSAGGLPSVAGLSGPASYQQSNAFNRIGYSWKEIDSTHYVVRADGEGKTALPRLEQMALARAGELGSELKYGWLKVEGSETGTSCGKKVDGYKGSGIAQLNLRSVKLQVAYAKTQVDPSWQRSDATFATAKAAFDAAASSPEAAAADEAELKAACDKR